MKTFEIIKKNIEFQRVFEKGHSIFSRYLVVYFLPNSVFGFRCGFAVGKKIGSAVTRNRIKRILREAVRLSNEAGPTNTDIIFIARNRILDADLRQVITDVEKVLIQIKKETLKKEGETEDSQ